MALSWCLSLQAPTSLYILASLLLKDRMHKLNIGRTPVRRVGPSCSLTFERNSQQQLDSVSHRLSSDCFGKITHIMCTHQRADISREHNIIDTFFRCLLFPYMSWDAKLYCWAIGHFLLSLTCYPVIQLGFCLDKGWLHKAPSLQHLSAFCYTKNVAVPLELSLFNSISIHSIFCIADKRWPISCM